jgi:hypothetical protein
LILADVLLNTEPSSQVLALNSLVYFACGLKIYADNHFPTLSRSGNSKVILVTGHEGPQGCETSRLPHFLNNQLTDGCEVFSLTRRQHL